MPTASQWFQFSLIHLAFLIQVGLFIYFARVADIKANWQKYRCNPWYMPLSDDLGKDFTYCVQTVQINMMGYLLQPMTYLMRSMIQIGQQLAKNMNDSRAMFNQLRNNAANVVVATS